MVGSRVGVGNPIKEWYHMIGHGLLGGWVRWGGACVRQEKMMVIMRMDVK